MCVRISYFARDILTCVSILGQARKGQEVFGRKLLAENCQSQGNVSRRQISQFVWCKNTSGQNLQSSIGEFHGPSDHKGVAATCSYFIFFSGQPQK